MRNFEFPEYPKEWIILEEDLVDETCAPNEWEPLGQHYHYKTVKILTIDEDGVGVSWASCWLSPSEEADPCWRMEMDSGGNFTFDELRRVLAILGPNF